MKNEVKSHIRSPFLIKLLLTIGLLICAPMFILQIFIFYSSYHTLNTQNSQYYYQKTQNLSSSFYSQLSAFRTIALKISNTNSTSIRRYANPNAPDYTAISASEELSNYLVSVPLAQELGIYYIDRKVFLDTSFYYKLENFCVSFSNNNPAVYQKIHSLFTEPFDGKYKMISSIPPGAVTPEDVRNNQMIVAIPVKMNSYTDYDAIVYFIINHESINSFLSTNAPSENYTYAIFGDTGDLLFTSNTENLSDFSSEEFGTYLSDSMQTTYDFSESSNVTAYKWADPTSSGTFITIVGESDLEENSKAFFRTMELILLVNILTTAALLCLTAYINYNPLRKLVSKITTSGQSRRISEFDQIEQVIQELDSRASDQGVVIMDYVLNDLLYGMTVKQPALERLIPNFHFRYFCAVSVICRRPTSGQSKQIADQIEEQTGCRIYITDIPNNECCLFVCLSKEAIDLDGLTASISDAVLAVLEEPGSVFAGNIVEKLDDISSSYYASQAQMGAGTSLVYGQDYPSAELHLLEHQIASGHISAAVEPLDAIFAYIHQNRHDRTLCRYVCYEVLSTYLSARKKATYPVTDEEFRELLLFKDADNLCQMLKTSMSCLEQKLSSDTRETGTRQQREIVEYVDQNFCRSDISLVTVADQFGISIYMVSRLFKNQTGAGFKEYITAKRLELASQMLADTKEPVSAIALKVGFENPTYFASLFRARYGVAPSKYRDDGVSRK